MIKKLLLSLLIIAGVGGSVFAGTQALLSDESTLTANTFTTGTINLLVDNDTSGNDFSESAVGFSQELFPGQTATNYLRLKNDASGIGLSIQGQATNVSGVLVADDVTVTLTAVDGSNNPIGTPVTKTLTEWEETIQDLGEPVILSDGIQRYQMDVTLSEDITESGADVVFDFVFTGTQVLEP